MTINRVRPLEQTSDACVIGFNVRVTLEEGGQTIFNDFPIEVDRQVPLDAWTEGDIRRAVETALRGKLVKQLADLHQRLDLRLGVVELSPLDLEWRR